jgi:hypothetical protein
MDSLVERKARAAFAEHAEAALRLLAEYQGPDTTRVQLALLKLSGRDFGQLELQVGVAEIDYRDAIRFAESPRIAVLWPSTLAAMSDEEKATLAAQDRAEYAAWLET